MDEDAIQYLIACGLTRLQAEKIILIAEEYHKPDGKWENNT